MFDVYYRPIATYRLQFNPDFGFRDAQALVPYFSRLGVTHLYASPILRARQTSTHGYDVVDPKTINSKLGDETELIDLVTDLRHFGLGLILDIVPNHTAASIENPYWRDVLTYGSSSPFASWFDIDWRQPDPEMWGRVLLPVLGEPRLRVLAQNQFRLVWSDGRFLVEYFDHVFPVDPATVPMICKFGLEELDTLLRKEDPTREKIVEILGQLRKLPRLATRLRRHVDIDRDETEEWLAQLARLVVQSPRIQQWAESTAERFGQGEAGHRRMKQLLDNQPYRLVHWRLAARTINYRRFFDINELISVRQEDPRVFEETHATVLRWVHEGLVDGLRIDHIDGLRDPLGYLDRLAEAVADPDRSRPIPIFVEKILASGEKLPCAWPVAGTTGYEFLNQVEATLVSAQGFATVEEQYRRMVRRPVEFRDIAAWGKRRVLRNDLSPQVGRLADVLLRLSDNSRIGSRGTSGVEAALAVANGGQKQPNGATNPVTAGDPDDASGGLYRSAGTLVGQSQPTKSDFVEAIVEVVTALPIYRTYVDGQRGDFSDMDRRYLQRAIQRARQQGRGTPEAIDFLGEILLLQNKSHLSDQEIHERVNFVQRFQQLTGPAAAKGIEDTALYAYVPLVSLNEVGGEPEIPEAPLAKLHQANDERAAAWPQNMLCVTTHDTKRTADVRARLDVLTEVPKLWFGLVRRWQRLNRPHRSRVRGKDAPEAATEYLFYQTVVGIWPAPDPDAPGQLPPAETLNELRERIESYMMKAVREAKTHTSWTDTNQEYEDAVLSFVRSLLLLDGSSGTPFLSDVQKLVNRIARPGFWNSLSRTLIQFTAPGSPDLYQGDELWNYALVDPDNRRPVDYELRRNMLDEIITGMEGTEGARCDFLQNIVSSPEDGRIKLHVIRGALAARGNHPQLFGNGQYLPLATSGSTAHHLIAFARLPSNNDTSDRKAAVIVVPRLTATLVSATDIPLGPKVWDDACIPLPETLQDRTWCSVFTRQQIRSGESLAVANVLESYPVALLISEGVGRS